MPARNQTSDLSRLPPRPLRMIGSAQIGTATSNARPTSTPKKDGDVTPMTSNRCPSRRTVPPIADELAPNSRCQNA
jgi:hypothetical protein